MNGKLSLALAFASLLPACGSVAPQSDAWGERTALSSLATPTPFKGVAYSNGLDGAACSDLQTLGASWYYNWSSSTNCTGTAAQFVPQIWGDWTAYGSTSPAQAVAGGAKYLLGFNEPDGVDQANLTVDRAIALWPNFNLPGVQIGSPAAAGTVWLDQFMQQVAAKNLRVDFIAMHWYGWDAGSCDNVSGLEGKIQWAEQYKRPIWITEFSCRLQSATVVNKFYSDALAMFGRHPLVARYAWYLTRATGDFANASLLASASGSPTTLGSAYIAAPATSSSPATGASSPLVGGGNYEIMSVNSSKCLDLPDGTWGNGLTYDQKTCDQSNAQRFQLWTVGDGTYYVVNLGSWQCLDATSGTLTQQTCNWTTGISPQHFYIGDWGTGQMDIRSQSQSGGSSSSCIDVSGMSTADGAHTGLWTCNGQMNQRWILRGITGELRDSSTGAAICVHPLGGATTPAGNTHAVLWNDCSKMDRIRYTLRNDGNLQHVSSGECLHPLGGVASAGTALVFYPACGYSSIAFRQLPNGAVQHKQTGLCLQRQNGSNANGTNIIFSTTCDAFSLDP